MKIKFTTESGVTKYLKLGISSVLGLQDILDTKSDTGHIHSEYALTTHNHDTVYSKLTHNHDTSYADISHNHDTVYSGIGHNHLISEVTGLQAALDNKAASNHNHDTVYADISHNHDTSYADISHNHDSAYADISHNHQISEVVGLQAALDNKGMPLLTSAQESSFTAENVVYAVLDA